MNESSCDGVSDETCNGTRYRAQERHDAMKHARRMKAAEAKAIPMAQYEHA